MNSIDYQRLWCEEHAAAFATAADLEARAPQLLQAFRAEVEAAIADGTSLAEMRLAFERSVNRHRHLMDLT